MTIEELHRQVVELNSLGKSLEEISLATGYAVSTVRTYIKKYAYLLDEYLSIHTPTIEPKVGHCAYLVYVNKGTDNVYTKVGYTKDFSKRVLQLKRGYGGVDIVPKYVFYFPSRDIAETMENFMRAYYITKYPSHYVNRDRFTEIRINKSDITFLKEYADKITCLFKEII